jgi:hypothetical protein
MKADIPINEVKNITVVAALGAEEGQEQQWHVYVINENDRVIEQVFVRSLGYGIKEGLEIKTSTLRHMIGNLDAQDYARIEPIDEQVFGLSNEYWVSYRLGGQLFDKKFVFEPYSIDLSRAKPVDLLGGAVGVRLN